MVGDCFTTSLIPTLRFQPVGGQAQKRLGKMFPPTFQCAPEFLPGLLIISTYLKLN